jgi:hypothetical protein
MPHLRSFVASAQAAPVTLNLNEINQKKIKHRSECLSIMVLDPNPLMQSTSIAANVAIAIDRIELVTI